jgi:hypothetical protein
VILACNGVGTPRLLLNSASVAKRFPNGLANSSGLVGKNLMFHPYAPIVSTAMSTSRWTAIAGRTSAPGARSSTRPTVARLRARLHVSVRPRRRPGHDRDHRHAARTACPGARIITGRIARSSEPQRIGMVAICEDLPEEHNTVTLDPVLKDANGIPAPKIDYTLSENSQRRCSRTRRAARTSSAAGAKNVGSEAPLERRLASDGHRAHGHRSDALGGQRMGPLPRRQEPVHRRRQHLGDLGGVNPTSTIQALALYIADSIKQRLSQPVRLSRPCESPQRFPALPLSNPSSRAVCACSCRRHGAGQRRVRRPRCRRRAASSPTSSPASVRRHASQVANSRWPAWTIGPAAVSPMLAPIASRH